MNERLRIMRVEFYIELGQVQKSRPVLAAGIPYGESGSGN